MQLSRKHRPEPDAAKVQAILLAVAFFAVGICVGAFVFYRAAQARRAGNAAPIQLSSSTRTTLRGVRTPITIRYYSILGKASAPESLRAFAGRADRLLTEYEREAGGKISVTRVSADSDTDTAAATADGIRPFNLDTGEGCFLGITVAQQDHKESLPQLAPEWEQALESDLTRMIQRVTSAQSAAERVAASVRVDSEAAEAVRQSVTNFASVPIAQGRQILREATLKELKSALSDLEIQLKDAQKRLSEAQASNSEAEQQAALKEVEELQARQSQKIKEITARFQAQATALERLNTNR